ISTLLFLIICVVAFMGSRGAAEGTDAARWYSVIPPLLAVTLAFATQKLLLSLGAAVVTGGFLAKVPAGGASLESWGQGVITGPAQVWSSLTDSFNLQVLAFVALVLAMISVVVTSGGLQGVVSWLGR